MLEVNPVFQLAASAAATDFGCFNATVKRPLGQRAGDLGSSPSLVIFLDTHVFIFNLNTV